jgi:hypothetical protein
MYLRTTAIIFIDVFINSPDPECNKKGVSIKLTPLVWTKFDELETRRGEIN